MVAYCMKCREKRNMVKPVKVTLRNNRTATKGSCPVCRTKMFRMG